MKPYPRKDIPGEILTMTQLSYAWGCSTAHIMKCIEDGMPHNKTKANYEFDLEECERWWVRGYFDSLSVTSQKKIIKKFEGVAV